MTVWFRRQERFEWNGMQRGVKRFVCLLQARDWNDGYRRMEGDDPLPPSPHCGGVSFPRHPASSPDWPSAETGQNQLKCAPSTRSGKLWLFLHLRTQVPRAAPLPLRSHREDTPPPPWASRGGGASRTAPPPPSPGRRNAFESSPP